MGSPRVFRTQISNTENTCIQNTCMHKIKAVLVGDINVGKTSLAVRFAQDKFDDNYKHTIGASFIAKTAIVGGCVINFQIWDTAGQERYRSLVPMYLRGAHIALIVYDVTDVFEQEVEQLESLATKEQNTQSPEFTDSYGSVGFWLDALHHHGDMIQPVLVANKCDLEHSVDQSIAEIFAEDQNLTFFATSAKTGYNVDKLFHTMGSMVVNRLKGQTVDTLTREKSNTMLDTIGVLEEETKPKCVKRKGRCCRS